MKTLTILIGNIGAGKSTYIKELLKKNSNSLVFSKDMIRYMIGGGNYIFDLNIEPLITKVGFYFVESAIIEGKYNIIIDETNMSKFQRAEYLDIAEVWGYKKVAIIMPKLSKSESVNRRLQNPHGEFSKEVWESVWERKEKEYNEPTLEEFNEIIKL